MSLLRPILLILRRVPVSSGELCLSHWDFFPFEKRAVCSTCMQRRMAPHGSPEEGTAGALLLLYNPL